MNKFITLIMLMFSIVVCSAQISINEVTYDPFGNDGGSTAGEWIELYCNGGVDCDVSCYVITDGDWTITIPNGTIVLSNDFYVVGNASYANTPSGVNGSVSVDLDTETCGCTTGSSVMELTNSGEFVSLFNNVGTFIEGVIYENPSSGNLPENESDITSASISGCSAQTLDIDGNSASFINVGSGNDNTIAKDIDGVGTWEYRDGTEATPGGTNDIPAPVTLTSFSVKPSTNQFVTLNWSTSSEENNDYFSIEHSVDGRNFNEIDRIQGAGTTSDLQHYKFIHKNAKRGNNYYRLRQVDYDGTFSFSQIEVVVLEEESEIVVRPTLATTEVQLLFSKELDNNGVVEIVNFMGQVIETIQFSNESDQIILDVNDLDSGHYILRVNIENGIRTTRFVKL